MPDKLSHEAKDLLRKFDEATGDSLNAAKKAESDKNGGSETKEKKKKGFWK